ncbi:MAG: hypothetical protein EOS82_32285 [Mesorhizobium sp.]|uniref:hypothetical protein n=1 Tax=Mesorhizobium sp. TaxID=1871066 RepID=UPI000FE7CEE7|nr:hypothetical protein [Mesorhizobium sp.]RWQ39715.1 MAG: hypothetical protein EOS82_32285 [Mesorhizobium sp.]
MPENEIRLEARLTAIEYVITEMAKTVYVQAGLTSDHFRIMRENAREKLMAETFPGIDAALADHMGAEIADEVDRLYRGIEDAGTALLSRIANQGK